MIDTTRLTPDERALYERLFPRGLDPSKRDGLWLFACASWRTLGTMPAPAIEALYLFGYTPIVEFDLYAEHVARLRAAERRVAGIALVVLMAALVLGLPGNPDP